MKRNHKIALGGILLIVIVVATIFLVGGQPIRTFTKGMITIHGINMDGHPAIKSVEKDEKGGLILK